MEASLVTIVVLLILAGITITYVMGDNSILKKTSEAKLQTNIAKAREKLELVLSDAQIQKHTNPKYNQNDYLDALLIAKIHNIKVLENIVIVDNIAFEIDRSIPSIGKYVGEEKDLVFPEVQLSKLISENFQKATITIKAKEEKNGINRIVIMQNGFEIATFKYDNVKEEITIDYDKITRNGKYVVKVYSVLSISEMIEIEGLIPSIEYNPIGSVEYKKEHQVIMTVKEAGDKVINIKYQWLNTLKEPEENTFIKIYNKGETITQGELTGDWYLWTLLETESGFKRIERSEVFHFDNQGPVVTLTSTPISETEFGLTVTTRDEHSKLKECKFYIDNQLKETKDILEETINYTVNVDTMNYYETYVVITDVLGNDTRVECKARTKMYAWETYVAKNNPIYVKRGSKIVRITLDDSKAVYHPDKDEVSFSSSSGYSFQPKSTIGRTMFPAAWKQLESWKAAVIPNGRVGYYQYYNFVSTSGNSYTYDVKYHYCEQEARWSRGNSRNTVVIDINSNKYPANDHIGNIWYVKKNTLE